MTLPTRNQNKLGLLLIDMNLISSDDLARATERINGKRDLKIGEALVGMGVIDKNQLDAAICEFCKQRALRGKLTVKDALALADRSATRHRQVFDGLTELGDLASAAAKQGGK